MSENTECKLFLSIQVSISTFKIKIADMMESVSEVSLLI